MILCFIGHRIVADTKKVKNKLINIVLTLIEKGADIFLFGSRSDFNSLCWEVVTELKEKYPNIKRVCYNAPNETAFTSKEERKNCERFFSQMTKQKVHFTDYEQTVNPQKALKANKNAYIMRNQAMIDASDVCVFYYNKDYMPPMGSRLSDTFPIISRKAERQQPLPTPRRKRNRLLTCLIE